VLDFLKEVLKEKEKAQKENEQAELEKKVETEQPVSRPDKLRFITEQFLSIFRETYVSNPNDVTYQFSRKIADDIVNGRYQTNNELFKEGIAIGVYQGVQKIIRRMLLKK